MANIVAAFPDICLVEFDTGRFDDWCVYLSRPGFDRYAPRDVEYFSRLKEIGEVLGCDRIYKDFVSIYTVTAKAVSTDVLSQIAVISRNYGEFSDEILGWFTVLYAGMIAEENKQFARLKKRIKRLGVHLVLVDGMPPELAATYSYGKPWRVLDEICRKKGF